MITIVLRNEHELEHSVPDASSLVRIYYVSIRLICGMNSHCGCSPLSEFDAWDCMKFPKTLLMKCDSSEGHDHIYFPILISSHATEPQLWALAISVYLTAWTVAFISYVGRRRRTFAPQIRNAIFDVCVGGVDSRNGRYQWITFRTLFDKRCWGEVSYMLSNRSVECVCGVLPSQIWCIMTAFGRAHGPNQRLIFHSYANMVICIVRSVHDYILADCSSLRMTVNCTSLHRTAHTHPSCSFCSLP